MAEVGVLNLTIHDNSESAGEGLKHLADALNAVKTAKKGFNLTNIGQQLVNLSQTIQSAKGTSTAIRNLGTMFNAINKFSKLKDFTINSDKLRDYAKNMYAAADAQDRLAESTKRNMSDNNFWDGLLGNSGAGEAIKDAQNNIKSIGDLVKEADKNGNGWANIWRTQMYSSGPSGSNASSSFLQVKTHTEGMSQAYRDSIGSLQELMYKTMDIMSIMDKPLQYLADIYKTTTASMKGYESGVNAVLPKVQKLSSEEMLVAGNAKRMAEGTAQVTEVLEKLNNPKNSIEYTQDYFDKLSGVYLSTEKAIDESRQRLGQSADMFSIPAMLNDSPFKTASEEIYHYREMLGLAEKDTNFWASEYDRIQKRIKYNGTSLALEQEAGRAYASFEASLAKAEEYRDVIAKITEYMDNYQGTVKGMGDISGIWENYAMRQTLIGVDGIDAQAKAIEEIAKGTGLSVDEVMSQITELSSGSVKFIKVMDQVAGAEEKVNNATSEAKTGTAKLKEELDGVVDSSSGAVSKIELLQNRIQHLWGRIAILNTMPRQDEFGNDTGVTNAINNYLLQIGRTNEQIQHLIDKSHEAQEAMQFGRMKSAASDEISQRVQWTEQDISNLVDNYSQIDLMELKLRGMQQALLDDINQNKVDTQAIAERTMAIKNLQDKIDQLKNSQEEATETTRHLGFSFGDLRSNIKKAFPFISSLKNRLKNIITRRAIMYMIRQITSGLKEGVEHVYEYSKLIGSAFAPAMDSAKSSLAQMKNALGASVAPLLQMLIPVLQQVVSWFINLLNYANQFFALLNGQKTWTRALPQTVSAFDKQTKAAKGAGAAIKDLLADWDELNIIQSESGGGGSGAGTTAAEDYLNMFEEVSRFDNKVKDVVNFIKDNFDTILSVAKAIGTAILMWKISKIFGDSLSSLQRLSMVTGLVLTIAGIKLTTSAAEDIAKNGLNAGNALEAAGGIAATALGGSFVLGAAAKALGFSMAGGALMGAITGVAIGMGFLISTIHAETIENAYGTLEEDAETIKKNVMAYFNPEADALVKVRSASLEDEEGAVKKVGEALAVLEKDYPIAVTLKDKESVDKLQLDIGNLVLEAKNLILKRKQNTRDTILNSGQFADAESFIKFSDLQWDKTAEYIESLGQQMGELISKGITEGAELDGLQEKLARIVHAATYGQKSGEYAGKATMAGATLRRAGYTKDTVSNYIDTYFSERGYYEDQAMADALAQQAELKALWASIEERYNQGDKTATEADVERAKQAYEQFNIDKEVNRLLDMYLGEGDKTFATDLFTGLSEVLKKTEDDWVIQSMRNSLKDFAGNKLNSDAETYVSDLYDYLIQTIAEGTGQNADKLKKIFENTGIDPLSLLGDFGKELRDKIADTLINGRWTGGKWFDTEDIKKIAKIFSIDLDDYLTVKAQPEVEIEDKAKLATDLYKEIEDIINSSGLPKETIAIFNERLSQVADLQTLQSLKAFIDQNGLTDAMILLKNFLQGDGWTSGNGAVNTKFNRAGVNWNPERVLGFVGNSATSDTNLNNNANVTPVTEQDLSKAVETGTGNANKEQNELLNNIKNGIDQLLRKQWTVNITPSTMLGFVGRKSEEKTERVTGVFG